jgi:hypothetical protein
MTRRALLLGAGRLTAGALAAGAVRHEWQPAAAEASLWTASECRIAQQHGSTRTCYNISAHLINPSAASALNNLNAWSASCWALAYPGLHRTWHAGDGTALNADVSAVAFTAQVGQTPSIVQNVPYNQSSPTTSLQISITPTAGNDLILCGGTCGGLIDGVSDDQNGVWSEVCRADATNGSQIFQIHNVAGATTTITVSFGTSGLTGQGAVSEASGLTGASYFGPMVPGSGVSRGVSYVNESGFIQSGFWFPTLFIAAQQQNDLVIAVIATNSATVAPLTIAEPAYDAFSQSLWTDICATQANSMTVNVSWALLSLTRGMAGMIVSKPATAAGNSYWEIQAVGYRAYPGQPTAGPWLEHVSERTGNDTLFAATGWLLGTWCHFVTTCSDVTSNTPTVMMYINGIQVPVLSLRTPAGSPYTDSTIVELGNHKTTDAYGETGTHYWNNQFMGALADVCIWNRVISWGEAIQAMSGNPPSAGLVGRWLLPGDVSPELDSSGLGTSLTVNGATSGVPGGLSIGQGPPVNPGQAPITNEVVDPDPGRRAAKLDKLYQDIDSPLLRRTV